MKWLSKDKVIYLWSKIVALHKKSVTDVSISGKTVTITKGDGTKSTQTTQDTTYNVVSKSADGLAPQLPNETSTTKYLRQDGTWAVPPDNDTTYNVFKGATATNKGQKGLVPEPERGGNKDLLFGNGVWSDVFLDFYNTGTGGEIVLEANNTEIGNISSAVIPLVNDSKNGLMTAVLFSKLNGLPTGTELSKEYAKKSDITAMYRAKGSVADASKLPTTGNELGDVWSIEADSVYGPAGMNVVWTSEGEWDNLGGIMTLEEITNEELDEICV